MLICVAADYPQGGMAAGAAHAGPAALQAGSAVRWRQHSIDQLIQAPSLKRGKRMP